MEANNTNPTATEGGSPTPQEAGRTFTQDDVNRIVQERLAKEKTKAAADLAQREQDIIKREQEIQRVELMGKAKARLSGRNVPEDVLQLLDTSSEEAMERTIKIIEKLAPLPAGGAGFGDKTPPRIDYGQPSIRQAMGLNERK